ncbi:MAG: hypothetical protein HHJ11_11935 [Phycicoccus sp.]|nr:hypothetical protein [Phycicoccus sp.]
MNYSSDDKVAASKSLTGPPGLLTQRSTPPVLWCDQRLTGVVDWPNAATGNRGSDVGHCRLNLALLFDTTTAGDYLVMYERAAGVRVDRRADLRALLCFDLEWQRFIPRQVAGRAPLDLAGMPGRVAATIRGALDGIG